MLDLLDRLLAPFARLMVARGIQFPELAERLKAHYVEAAKDLSDGKLTDSRLSVLTGLQRRDVARLRSLPPAEPRIHHLARLIALWQNDPEYQGKDLPKTGPKRSFETLAKAVRKDIHPRTMLDTLEAAGAILIDPVTHDIRLLQASYQPLAGSEDQLVYLTQNLGDHFDAATDNVLGHKPKHFERAVHYERLTDEQVEQLKEIYESEQMAVLQRLSAVAAKMKSDAATRPTGHRQIRFRAGGYFYKKDEGPK